MTLLTSGQLLWLPVKRKQVYRTYLGIQQRVGFQQVVEGELSCTQLYWEVLMSGEGPAWRGGRRGVISGGVYSELWVFSLFLHNYRVEWRRKKNYKVGTKQVF